ncbi:hypothetical protein TWF106_001609 [Orbilia oligospora]|uniref:Uncharacterized protein n=1 Tax=Orbilia oligospora TaxID=2813651 RepID=A0A7C8UCY0_ORBOL|nr:hypothetical protein TWF106_001609 [Orbilia oligospora]
MKVAARQFSLAILFCGTFAQKSTTVTTIFITTRWTETRTCSSQLQRCEDVIWNPLVSSMGNGTVGPSSWLPSSSISPGGFSTFTTSRKTGSISTIASSYTGNVTVPSWSSISTPTNTPSSFVLQSFDGDSPDSYFQLLSDGRLGLVEIAETSAPRFMLQGGRLLTVEEPVEAIFLRRGTVQKRQDAISLDDIGELLHDILESGEILSTDILSRIFFNEIISPKKSSGGILFENGCLPWVYSGWLVTSPRRADTTFPEYIVYNRTAAISYSSFKPNYK